VVLLQAEQLMGTLMLRERRRLWNWWDDTQTRNTEDGHGRCVCSRPCICMRPDAWQEGPMLVLLCRGASVLDDCHMVTAAALCRRVCKLEASLLCIPDARRCRCWTCMV
jgi:hypothetical protein